MANAARFGLWLGLGLLMACEGADGDAETSAGTTDGTPAPLNCDDTVIAGHVVIESAEDLDQLDGVREVEGELQVDKTDFTNLDALGCLEVVGGELTVFGNDALTDVSGLDNLRSVGGGFIISENPLLPELGGLDQLTEVQGSVVLRQNGSMTRVDGFTSLATIGGGLVIRENDALTNIDGMQALRSVGGQLAITHNPSLCISSINRVGAGIVEPAVIPDNWSTRANDDDC
ncbi:MAG: hypothetical protein K0V04_00805 [Deltaproteobacteria bacterium]|nr:hypothetical protein [Deltaproteobacteria bacterium]